MTELSSFPDETKPKSIKTLGLAVIILSSLMLFGNSMGGIVFTLIGAKDILNQPTAGEIPKGGEMMLFIFRHYLELCLALVTLDAVFLIGGINLMKYKLWANRLISLTSILFICLIWGMMIAFFSIFNSIPNEMRFVSFIAIFVAIFWSTPFVFLIRHLNKKDIIVHFE